MTGKYIGLLTRYTPEEGSGVLKSLYPEGTVAVINNKGVLGAYITGRSEGIRVEEYKIFSTVEDGFNWVTQKDS